MSVMQGKVSGSNPVQYVDVLVDATGVLQVGGAIAGGGGGEDAALGAKDDAVATTDTGTFSLIALFKRSLQSLTTIATNTGAARAQKTTIGTRTALATAANSLADQTYLVLGTVTRSSDYVNDVLVEVGLTPGTVAGNKRAVLFCKTSVDGTNFTSGPESGTTATDEPNLYTLGIIPLNSNATAQRQVFSIVNALGFVPKAAKLILRNDSGAALAASGNDGYYAEITNPVS
jgi:hypothetical protein